MPKRCSYGTCNSDSRYPERLEGGVRFIPFPKPLRRLETCLRWIQMCGRPHHQLNVSRITQNTFICTKHFVDPAGPTEEHPDPIPADPSNSPAPKNCKYPKRKHLVSHLTGSQSCSSESPSTKTSPSDETPHTKPEVVNSSLKHKSNKTDRSDQSKKENNACKEKTEDSETDSCEEDAFHSDTGSDVSEEDVEMVTVKKEIPEAEPLNEPYTVREDGNMYLKYSWMNSDEEMETKAKVEVKKEPKDSFEHQENEASCSDEDQSQNVVRTEASKNSLVQSEHIANPQEMQGTVDYSIKYAQQPGRPSDSGCPSSQSDSDRDSKNSKQVPERDKSDKSSPKTFICNVCGKIYSSRHTLARHCRTHSEGKPYLCDVCGARFTSRGSLAEHQWIHMEKKSYKCDICEKGFITYDELEAHSLRHDTTDRPFKCDICGVGFAQSGQLTTHKRTHTGERPYVCDICGKGFTTSSHMAKHKRTHTGEKPYECEICGSRFSWPESFKTHKRRHTGETPYKCDYCGKGFPSGGGLQRHRRVHIDEQG